MKLAVVVNCKSGLELAYQMKLKNGARAIKLRRLITAVNQELKNFEEIKDGYIRETGKEAIGPADPEYAGIIMRINEAMNTEVDIAFEPLIEEADLENTEASAAEIDALFALGLIKTAEDKDKAPEGSAVPA